MDKEEKRIKAMKILGLDEFSDISDEEIKSAYREIVKRTHPDIAKNDKDVEQYIEATRAKDYLLYGKDDEEVNNDFSQIITMICQKLEEIIRSNSFDEEKHDLIKLAKKRINNEVEAIRIEIKNCQKQIRYFEKILKRIIYKKKKGNNFLRIFFEKQIVNLEGDIELRRDQRRLRRSALELLDDYEYQYEKEMNNGSMAMGGNLQAKKMLKRIMEVKEENGIFTYIFNVKS